MSRIHASVGILTFNSEATLRRALESVREFDDIIICDGGSTDATLLIAREFGARVISQPENVKDDRGVLVDFGAARQATLDAARYEWFLYIDSDESISSGLRDEITRVVSENTEALVYKIPIGILLDGLYVKYSSNYPGYQTRFFNKKSGARFIKPVHERIEYPHDISVGTFSSPWYIHTTRDDWIKYLAHNARYRQLEVESYCGKSLFAFFTGTFWRNLRAAASVCVKAAFNYTVHGFKETLPVEGEFGRALSPLLFVGGVLKCKFCRVFLHE